MECKTQAVANPGASSAVRSVDDIIRLAGGAKAISDASTSSLKPIGAYAVHKWRRNGIPDDHWGVVMGLAGVSVEQIYQANEDVRRANAPAQAA